MVVLLRSVVRLELDGNADNGPEEYIYGEEPRFSAEPLASYERVDLIRCQRGDGAAVSPERPIKSQRDRGVNALIKFETDHFIISFNEDLWSLHAWKYVLPEGYFHPAATCYWRPNNQ